MNTSPPSFNLLTILGPTASGKTRLAVALAQELNGEIISADSRQVFRGMDIGSGKDLHEYGTVPYHLIDILDAGEEFSVFAFQRHFLETYTAISKRGVLPVLCGGTGLYLDAVLRGYRMIKVPENRALREELAAVSVDALATMLRKLKPQLHNNTDLTDRHRTIRAIEIATFEKQSPDAGDAYPDIRPLVIGIRWTRDELRRRITKRLCARLENGLIDEVQRLHDSGIAWERLDYYGLEYRYISSFLRGETTRDALFLGLNSAIHNFAKRQENWFRRMEKNGQFISWIEGTGDLFSEAMAVICESNRI